MAITGAAVQWLRDNLGLIKSSAEIGQCIKSVGTFSLYPIHTTGSVTRGYRH